MKSYYILPQNIEIDKIVERMINEDYEKFCEFGMPQNVERFIYDKYGMDISSSYGKYKIKNPFGIASGQLSTNISQIKKGIQNGIGFIVLKTVISESITGSSSMRDWKVDAPKMVVEDCVSRTGEKGYTVTWKGRGWHKSFEEYISFFEESLILSKMGGTPVIPSCKFNLPNIKNNEKFHSDEYIYTLKSLFKAWKKVMGNELMHLEKDFSPTLSGSDLSKERDNILWWLKNVPEKIKKSTDGEGICLGVKVMNAVFEDEFQLEMLKSLFNKDFGPDYLICFNRLFDSNKVFEDKKGVAYGGYDLSYRNLKVLTNLRILESRGEIDTLNIPISGTGNICSGKMMIEYGLRGCENGQIHTLFQIPSSNYGMKKGDRISKTLNELLFNPNTGLIAGMEYLYEKDILEKNNGIIEYKNLTNAYKRHYIFEEWDDKQ